MTGASATLLCLLLLASCGGQPPAGTAAPSTALGSPYDSTREEFFLRVKACVVERGFPVEIDTVNWGFMGDYGTDERAQEASAAIRECVRAIDPKRLEPPPPPSDEQLSAWYVYQVARASCLQGLGYDVGSIPPEQVFIDTVGGWDPVQALIASGTPARNEDAARCNEAGDRPTFLDW